MRPARCRCEDREVSKDEQRAGVCSDCGGALPAVRRREKAVRIPPETRGA